MSEYLCAGNIMADCIEDADGNRGPFSLGGDALFGTAGVRLWDSDVAMVCHSGSDFDGSYGKWLKANGVSDEYVVRMPAESSKCLIQHRKDGTYKWIPLQGIDHIRSQIFTGETLLNAVTEDTKGIYMFAEKINSVFEVIGGIREKNPGLRIMWELWIDGKPYDSGLEELIGMVDMFSVNRAEAALLFGMSPDDDKALISRLRRLPAEFIFFRCGSDGAYGITKDGTWFCPSVAPLGRAVDPAGCGNSSTAAAMYGYTEGFPMEKVLAGACVSAGFMVAQPGVYPVFTAEDRELAEKTREVLSRKVVRTD